MNAAPRRKQSAYLIGSTTRVDIGPARTMACAIQSPQRRRRSMFIVRGLLCSRTHCFAGAIPLGKGGGVSISAGLLRVCRIQGNSASPGAVIGNSGARRGAAARWRRAPDGQSLCAMQRLAAVAGSGS